MRNARQQFWYLLRGPLSIQTKVNDEMMARKKPARQTIDFYFENNNIVIVPVSVYRTSEIWLNLIEYSLKDGDYYISLVCSKTNFK